MEMTRNTARPSESYAELLPRVLAGDREAEAAMVQLLASAVRAILRNLACGHEPIADLTQEALITVVEAVRDRRISDVPHLLGFAAETARCIALNAERRSQRRQTDCDHDLMEAISDDGESVERAFEQPMRRACIEEVLGSLHNADERQALYCYYLDERPAAQVQSLLAISSTQLARLLYRARHRFESAWRKRRFETPVET